MKNSLVAVTIVIAVLIGGLAGYATGVERTVTTTRYSTSTLLVTSTRTTHCVRLGQGYAFYINVVADRSGTPVSGAEVDAISYTVCASGDTDWGSPITALTPNNGTISLPVSAIDGYSIIINYQNSTYYVGEVFIAPVQVTNVTLTVPSGNVTVAHSYPA